MSDVFLETTAVIGLAFGNHDAKGHINSHIPSGSRRITSQYVIYEVYRGYLRYLRLLHNKTLQLNGFSEIFEYVGRLHYMPSYVGAVLGNMKKYFDGDHPKLSDPDRLVHFRGFLRKEIRRGFARISAVADVIINQLGCRDAGTPYEDDGGLYQHTLGTELCGKHETCGLKGYAYSYRVDLGRIRDGLARIISPDAETKARIKYLRELYRVPKRDFPKTACFRSSDALIVHESPVSSTILTNNKKHIEPLSNLTPRNADYF
ncbi:MAG: hypothetical protein H0X40_11765 [Chthoniobacterales bacterium]|nr:hypothetical protein [Chthoniobacterales bacterium]